MKFRFDLAALLGAGLVLAACTPELASETALTKSEMAALDATPVSSMPTGTATYEGELSYDWKSDDGYSGTTKGDYTLDANFDDGTVTNTATNIVDLQYRDGEATSYTETTGSFTGEGVITGNSFVADLSGTLTSVRSGTTADDAADLAKADQEKFEGQISVSGQFVGDTAEAIYGTKTTTEDGLTETTTVSGNKQ